MSADPLVVDVTEVTSWRERAEQAQERAELAERRAERAEARIEELVEQVAVLSRMLFGRSSEKASAGKGEPQAAVGSSEQAEGSEASAAQLVGTVRAQVTDLLSELEDAVADGKTAEDVAAALVQARARLSGTSAPAEPAPELPAE